VVDVDETTCLRNSYLESLNIYFSFPASNYFVVQYSSSPIGAVLDPVVLCQLLSYLLHA
jgi:hypothetical protein